MPVQLIRNVRQRQPLKAAKIDYSNPISKEIVFAFEAGAGQRDLVTGVAGESIGSGVSPSAGKFGRDFDFSGSQANRSCSFGVHLGLMGATEATWDIMIYFDAGNASAHFFGQWDNNQKWLLQNNVGQLVWVPAQDDSLGRRRFNSSAPVFGSAGWYRVILSWFGGSSAVMMINRSVVGATQVNSNGVVIGPANTADYLQIGMVNGGSPLAGNVLFARAWRRGLSLSEMFSLNDNPWQIFDPETIPLFWSGVTAQSATASIAAAIRSDRTASASLSAAIQSAATASATLSGAIQTAQSATSGLTAYIVASGVRSESISLSAAISAARTATSSLSAAVAAARTATATLDSAVQIEATASTGVSAAIREAFSLSANLSGAVQASATASASLAAVVATTNAISSGLSAAVRAEQAAFATLSAYIAADVVLTQAEVDMLTDIWQRFGLDPLAPLTETETSASFGGIVLSKSGTNPITSTRSGNSAAGVASTMILDMWQRLGLDPDNPMTASETQISAGALSQARAVSGATVTVTRTP